MLIRQRDIGRLGYGLSLVIIGSAPLALGSVHEGVIIVESIGAAVALGLMVGGSFGRNPMFLPWAVLVLGAVGLTGALQLVPLPRPILQTLSPEALTLWDQAYALSGQQRTAYPISVDPPDTMLAVARALGLFFLAITQVLAVRAMGIRAIIRLSWTLALSGAVAVLLGVAFTVITPGRLLGFYTPEAWGRLEPVFRATFVNANHQAAAFGISAMCAMELAWHDKGIGKKVAVLILILTATAMALCGSRGSLVLYGIGLIAVYVAAARNHLRGPRRVLNVIGPFLLGVIVLFNLALMSKGFLFVDKIPKSASEVTSGILESLALRKTIVEDGWAMLAKNPLVGVGLGAFGKVFPMYNRHTPDILFAHLENEPLELLASIGLVAGGLFLGVMFVQFVSVLAKYVFRPCFSGPLFALALLGVHNLADFNLSTNGVAAPASALLGATLANAINRWQGPPPALSLYGVTFTRKVTVMGLIGATMVIITSATRPFGMPLLPSRLSGVSMDLQGFERVKALSVEHPAYYYPFLVAAEILQAIEGPVAAKPWLDAAALRAPSLVTVKQIKIRNLLLAGEYTEAQNILSSLREFRRRWPLEDLMAIYALPRVREKMVFLAPTPDPGRDSTLDLVRFFRKVNRQDLAESVLVRALEASPADPILAMELAALHLSQGKVRQAEDLGTKVMLAHPEDPEGYIILGKALLAKGATLEALHMFLEGLKQRPNDETLLLATVQAAVRVGDSETFGRLDPLLRSRCASPEICARAWLARGEFMLKQGNLVEAKEAAETAARLKEDDESVACHAATILEQAHGRSRAIFLLREFLTRHRGTGCATRKLDLLEHGTGPSKQGIRGAYPGES